MGLVENLILLFWWRSIAIRWLITAFCFACRSVPSSDLIRENCSCSRKVLTHRPMPGQYVENVRLWSTVSSGISSSLSSRPRDICRRGCRKIVRARGEWMTPGKCVFYTQEGWHTEELTRSVSTCTRTVQVQARQCFSTEMGEVDKGSHPYTRSYRQLIPAGKEKISFLQWVYQPHFRSDPISKCSWLTQNELMVLLYTF